MRNFYIYLVGIFVALSNAVAIDFSVQGYGVYNGSPEHFLGSQWTRAVQSWSNNETKEYHAWSDHHDLTLERIEIWDIQENVIGSGGPNGSVTYNGWTISWTTNVISTDPGEVITRVRAVQLPQHAYVYTWDSSEYYNGTGSAREYIVTISSTGNGSLIEQYTVNPSSSLTINAEYDTAFTYSVKYLESDGSLNTVESGSAVPVQVEYDAVRYWNGDVYEYEIVAGEVNVGDDVDTDVPPTEQTDTPQEPDAIPEPVPEDDGERQDLWQTDAETLDFNQEQRYSGIKEELVKSRNKFSEQFASSRQSFKAQFDNFNLNEQRRQEQDEALWVKGQENIAGLINRLDNNQRVRHQEIVDLWNRQKGSQDGYFEDLQTHQTQLNGELKDSIDTGFDGQGVKLDAIKDSIDNLSISGSLDGTAMAEGIAAIKATVSDGSSNAASTDWETKLDENYSLGEGFKNQIEELIPSGLSTGTVSVSSVEDDWIVEIPGYGSIDMQPFRASPWIVSLAAVVREIILWALVVWFVRDFFDVATKFWSTLMLTRSKDVVVGPENLVPLVPQGKWLLSETLVIGVIISFIAALMLFMDSQIGRFGFSDVSSLTVSNIQLSGKLGWAWEVMDMLLPMNAIILVAVLELVFRFGIMAMATGTGFLIKMLKL